MNKRAKTASKQITLMRNDFLLTAVT